MIRREVWEYWQWVGSNIGALPLEALITAVATAVFGIVFRKHVALAAGWVSRTLHRDTAAALAELRADFDALDERHRRTHQIISDLWLHQTSSVHELAASPNPQVEASLQPSNRED